MNGFFTQNSINWRQFGYLLACFILMIFILGQTMSHSQPSQRLTRLEFAPRDEPYSLGNHILGQYEGAFSADPYHIRLRFDRYEKQWLMENVSTSGKKLLFITPEKREFIARQWQLEDGDVILAGEHQLRVNIKPEQGMLLTNLDTKATYYWNYYQLFPSAESNFSGCPRAGKIDALRRYLRHFFLPITRGNDNRFTLGGQVACHDRLRLEGVPLFAATIIHDHEGRFFLQPDLGSPIYLHRNNQRLPAPSVRLQSGDSFIAGKTRYRLSIQDNNNLHIIPYANIHFFPADADIDTSNSAAPVAIWEKNHYWDFAISFPTTLSNGGKIMLVVWLLFLVFYQRWMRRSPRPIDEKLPALSLMTTVAGLFWFMIYFYIPIEQLGLKMLLFFALWLLGAMQIVLYSRGKMVFYQFWLILSALMGFGLLMQLQLASGSISSRWYGYPNNQLRFFASLIYGVILILPLPRSAIHQLGRLFQFDYSKLYLWQRVLLITFIISWISLLTFLAALAYHTSPENGKMLWAMLVVILFYIGIRWLLAHRNWADFRTVLLTIFTFSILAQGLFGTEEGIAGVQPIELAKTLFVWLLGTLTLRYYYRLINDPPSLRPLIPRLRYNVGAYIAILTATVFSVSWGVSDYSPLIILVFVIYTFIWLLLNPISFNIGSFRRFSQIIYLLSFVAAIFMIYYIYQNIEIAKNFPQSERFFIWHNPWNYPDSGRQLQLALSAVNGGGNNWFGANSFGNNGSIQNLPAVQDDFALAFFLHKFGGTAGILLLFLQILWLQLLLRYYQIGIKKSLRENHTEQRTELFISCSLFGFAMMQLIHWLISWGNTLGMLPIMGQPMTFLSSGNSHLFALAFPETLFLLIMIKLNETNYR